MMADHPLGKGFFIWQLERCAGGDPGRLAAAAQAAGLAWVSFKIANGTAPRNGDISRHVRALADVGCASWGWSYVYGWAPEAESRIAIERVRGFGLAGYMLNAEHEYKRMGADIMARRAMDVFRMVPEISVGLCSYRFPSLHRQLPWHEFLEGCTFHNPQVYWLESNAVDAPTTQLNRSLSELRALRNLPVVPLGVASPNDAATWFPTVAQLDNFHAGVVANGLDGFGYWSWEHAERRADWWNTIARHASAPLPPVDTTPAQITGHATAIIGLV